MKRSTSSFDQTRLLSDNSFPVAGTNLQMSRTILVEEERPGWGGFSRFSGYSGSKLDPRPEVET